MPSLPPALPKEKTLKFSFSQTSVVSNTTQRVIGTLRMLPSDCTYWELQSSSNMVNWKTIAIRPTNDFVVHATNTVEFFRLMANHN